MIFGHAAHWEEEKHAFASAIRRGMEFILGQDTSRLEPGKYPIEGDSLFALVQTPTTAAMHLQKPESHRKYLDIQFLVSGEEKMGVAQWSEDQPVTENLFEEKDLAFYGEVKNEIGLFLTPGNYAVFFPSDIHRPNCTVNEDSAIRKVVIKIHTDLLK